MKCKIAVIDTGYSFTNDFSGFSFMYANHKILENTDFTDINGHGTNVIETILKFSTDVEIIPIKIANAEGLTNKLLLLSALEKCLSLNIDIVNLSISCTISDYDENLEIILRKLVSKNIIVVTSLLNASNDGYPGTSIYTIGIGAINLGSLYSKCKKKANKIFLFNSNPIFVKGYNNYNFFKGTSKATALCTSILANAYNKGLIDNLDNSLKYLETLSISDEEAKKLFIDYTSSLQNMNFLYSEEICKLLESIIYSITQKYIVYDNDCNIPTFSNKTGLNFANFDIFLNKICESLNITIDKENINIEEVYSISALINLLQRRVMK